MKRWAIVTCMDHHVEKCETCEARAKETNGLVNGFVRFDGDDEWKAWNALPETQQLYADRKKLTKDLVDALHIARHYIGHCVEPGCVCPGVWAETPAPKDTYTRCDSHRTSQSIHESQVAPCIRALEDLLVAQQYDEQGKLKPEFGGK